MSVEYGDLLNMERCIRHDIDYTNNTLNAILFRLDDIQHDINDMKKQVGLSTLDDKIKLRKIESGELVATKIFNSKDDIREYIDKDIELINDRYLILNDMKRTYKVPDPNCRVIKYIAPGVLSDECTIELPVKVVECSFKSDVAEIYKVKIPNKPDIFIEYYY